VSAPAALPPGRPLVDVGVPALFVVFWSSGFVFAKLGLPHAEPATFLALRFALTCGVVLPLALAIGARWPRRWQDFGHAAFVGLAMHVLYLGGVFAGIAKGVPAGVSALIVGLQPVLTATVVGPFLGERVRPVQWLGLALGLAGIVLVLREKLALGEGSALGYALCFGALFGITAGSLYQKKFCAGIDLAAGGVIQYGAALLAIGALALVFERGAVAWTGEFVLALAWLAIVLSVFTWTLLMWLIRRGAAAKVASLFYLVPPVAALMGYALFGESFGWLAILGMALAAAGVALANR
jgi:drug/metabolite transporter (DMT)-like permease